MISGTTQYGLIIRCAAVWLLCLLLTGAAMAQETGDHDREKWNGLNQKAVSAYHAGKYADGLRFAEQAYQFALDHFGEKDPDTLTSLRNLAMLYLYSGRYVEAEPLLKKALSLRESVLGPEHPDTLISLSSLAALYRAQGRYEEAEPLYQKALSLSESVLGPDHPDTLSSLNNLALLYRSQGRYGDAEPLLRKALSLRESVLGPKHPDTLANFNNLATLYYSQGRYGEAEPLYRKALSLSESVLGPEHPQTLVSLNNLAALYDSQGRYGEAEPLYQKVLFFRESVLGSEHPDTLTSLNNLALLYDSQGRYEEAEPLFRKALSLHESVFGPEHPSTLTSLNNLALCFYSQGRYGEAEPLFRKALSLRESVLGPEHPDTLTILNNLAGLYSSQGRYGEAEPIYQKALTLRESVLRPEHPDTLSSLSNLAFSYKSQGRYGEAETLYRKALSLRESVLGAKHPDTMISMNNLAALYRAQGRYGEAEPLYEKALSLRESVLGPEHPDTLTILNNLALVYRSQGRYGEAEPLFRKALSLRESVLGPEHPHTLASRLNYAVCLTNLKHYDQALFQLKKAEAASLARTGHLLKTTLKQRVRGQHLLSASTLQNIALTLAIRYSPDGSKAFAADVLLRWKEIQAEEDAYVGHLVQTTNDPEVRALGRDVMDLRSSLTGLPFQEGGDDQRPKLLARLETLELNLAEKSREYKGALQVFNAGMERVRYALPPKTALIEFRHFQPVDFKTGDLEDHHWAAALVYSEGAGGGLFFEDLGPVDATRELWTMLRLAENNSHFKYLSKRLYQKLFVKFEDTLKDFDALYIAPDGFLHQVAFSRLILPDGRYWAERQQIRRIHTGRDLVRQMETDNTGKLIAVGGIDYNHYPDDDKPAVPFADGFLLASADVHRAGAALDPFKPLPASRLEAQRIESTYTICRGPKVETLLGGAATEGALKRLDEPPAVLHLSTHGFFLPDDDDVERPLVLSGLALAGANLALAGKAEPDRDDGLLFSMEVLGLNLKGTELVSLSACKTGTGRIDYSEGVYGLVRAFRVAGARSVLMTLWSVKDDEANEFMTTFYRNWLQQPEGVSDPAEALHDTRKEYIKDGVDPRVWAPYVLVGK